MHGYRLENSRLDLEDMWASEEESAVKSAEKYAHLFAAPAVQEIDRLKSQLAEKDLLINQLNLGISQRNQTEDIVSQLKTTCGCNCN